MKELSHERRMVLPWKAAATANILLLDIDELIGHSPENGRPGSLNEKGWGLRSRMLDHGGSHRENCGDRLE